MKARNKMYGTEEKWIDSITDISEWEEDLSERCSRSYSDASSLGTLSSLGGGLQYCTPSSLTALENLGGVYEYKFSKLSGKANIWSMTYRSSWDSLVPRRNKEYTYEPLEEFSFLNKEGELASCSGETRFFIIKSHNVADVEASIRHGIWTSTNLGNKRLNKAYEETRMLGGKIFLLFLVNASGRFCGLVEMTDRIDFTRTSDIWVEKSRWRGIFPVKWHIVKEISNRNLQHLKNSLNEFKSVTNSRDTQEVPYNIGCSMVRIFESQI